MVTVSTKAEFDNALKSREKQIRCVGEMAKVFQKKRKRKRAAVAIGIAAIIGGGGGYSIYRRCIGRRCCRCSWSYC